MQKRTTYIPDDAAPSYAAALTSGSQEPSLLGLWLVFGKRWRWFLGGVFCGVFAAIAYTLMIAPAYESRANIQVGKVQMADSRLIDDLDALALELVEQYGPESSAQSQNAPYLKQASKAPGQNNILRLAVVGNSPEEARDFLAQILKKLMARHEKLYTDIIAPFRRRLAVVEERIGILTTQVAKLGQIAGRLEESNPMQSSLIMMERARLYVELNQLERERLVLQQQTSKPYSNSSEVIVSPTLPDKPTIPRTIVVIAVGVMAGLAAGVVAVFVRESFATLKADLRTGVAPKPYGPE